MINFHSAETLPLLATVLRQHADAIEGSDPTDSRELRRRSFRFAHWAARVTRFFPPHQPYALREFSIQLAARGKVAEAFKLAHKSCAIAQIQKAKYEYTQSLVVRATLAERLGMPGALDELSTAKAALAAFQKPTEEE